MQVQEAELPGTGSSEPNYSDRPKRAAAAAALQGFQVLASSSGEEEDATRSGEDEDATSSGEEGDSSDGEPLVVVGGAESFSAGKELGSAPGSRQAVPRSAGGGTGGQVDLDGERSAAAAAAARGGGEAGGAEDHTYPSGVRPIAAGSDERILQGKEPCASRACSRLSPSDSTQRPTASVCKPSLLPSNSTVAAPTALSPPPPSAATEGGAVSVAAAAGAAVAVHGRLGAATGAAAGGAIAAAEAQANDAAAASGVGGNHKGAAAVGVARGGNAGATAAGGNEAGAATGGSGSSGRGPMLPAGVWSAERNASLATAATPAQAFSSCPAGGSSLPSHAGSIPPLSAASTRPPPPPPPAAVAAAPAAPRDTAASAIEREVTPIGRNHQGRFFPQLKLYQHSPPRFLSSSSQHNYLVLPKELVLHCFSNAYALRQEVSLVVAVPREVAWLAREARAAVDRASRQDVGVAAAAAITSAATQRAIAEAAGGAQRSPEITTTAVLEQQVGVAAFCSVHRQAGCRLLERSPGSISLEGLNRSLKPYHGWHLVFVWQVCS